HIRDIVFNVLTGNSSRPAATTSEAAAGVRYHVSNVGTDRADNGFRAKVAQEKLIKASGIPYTITPSSHRPSSWNAPPRNGIVVPCRPRSPPRERSVVLAATQDSPIAAKSYPAAVFRLSPGRVIQCEHARSLRGVEIATCSSRGPSHEGPGI